MKKYVSLFFLCTSFAWSSSFSQLSVCFSEKENVIGIAVGPTNNNGERDSKAYEDCQRKGGTYCRTVPVNPLLVMAERYGCYAIVQGKTKDGITVTGCYDMSSSQVQAAKDATYYVVTFLNALPNSVSTVFQDCLEKPKPSAQPNAVGGSQQQWSEWKTDNCFKGLRYRMKHYTVYDLNKQYHYYFEFVSTYNKTVYFDYNLLDADGKVRFGNRHTIKAGEKIEFNHKMTSNYIASTQVEKLNFDPYSNEYQSCDAPGAAASSSPPVAAPAPDPSPSPSRAELEQQFLQEFKKDAVKYADYMCRMFDLMKRSKSPQNDPKVFALQKEFDNYEETLKAKYKKNQSLSLNFKFRELFEEELKRRGCSPE